MQASATWSIHTHDDGVSFDVVVVPRASRSRVVGVIATPHGAALKLTLAAPPRRRAADHGEANAEPCAPLAKALDVPRRSVQITHGEHNKHKTVRVRKLG